MNRWHYYESLKALARKQRLIHGLTGPCVCLSNMRAIYRKHGIRIDLWKQKLRVLRGAYFVDSLGPTVMIDAALPVEPRIFTMGHELKHHLVDRNSGHAYCAGSNDHEPIEIGAEVFAAELIYPEQDFSEHLKAQGITTGRCDAEALVRLKHDSGTTLSYAALAKRAQFLGFASDGSLAKVKWKKLEEAIYGLPLYKRLLRRRRSGAR